MSQRIWRKNAINFQHCFILKLVKYVTHMVKKCNALFYFKYVATQWRKNAINFQY